MRTAHHFTMTSDKGKEKQKDKEDILFRNQTYKGLLKPLSELVTNVCIQKECTIAPISRPERLKAAKDEVLIKDHSDHEESTMLMVVLNYK